MVSSPVNSVKYLKRPQVLGRASVVLSASQVNDLKNSFLSILRIKGNTYLESRT
jgi:hypothetical protein